MVYNCRQCGTQFNVPDEKLKPEGSRFRCTKCGTPFVLRKPAAAPPRAQVPPSGAIACPRCGGFNGSLARFCAHCGSPLGQMPYAGRYAGKKKGTNPGVIIAIVIGVFFVGTAVIGMLAAIAIPAFLGQREKARMRALEANYKMAVYYVQEELQKCSTDRDSVTTDVVAELNAGDAFNPWFPEAAPFSTSLGNGQVAISHYDLRALCGTNTEVVIVGDARGDGIAGEQLEQSIRVSGPQGSEFTPRGSDRNASRSGRIGL